MDFICAFMATWKYVAQKKVKNTEFLSPVNKGEHVFLFQIKFTDLV